MATHSFNNLCAATQGDSDPQECLCIASFGTYIYRCSSVSDLNYTFGSLAMVHIKQQLHL